MFQQRTLDFVGRGGELDGSRFFKKLCRSALRIVKKILKLDAFSAPKSFKKGMQKQVLFCCSVFSRICLHNGDLTNSPPLPSESKLRAASGAPGAASGGILFVSFSALESSRWSKSSRDLKIIENHLILTTNLNRNLKCMQKHGSRFLMSQEPWNNQFCRILERSFPSSSATAR